MKALVFRHSLAREAAAAMGGRFGPRAFVSPYGPVRLEEIGELPLPAKDWVRVETVCSGLCGSDVKQILLNGRRDNPLTALVSFPHVLGHEVVGRRADTGQRVVLNPWLSCGPRGIDPPCEACRAGRYPWCRNFRRGDLPVSIHLGNCAAAGGAHAERFAAHPSQLFAIPDGVCDEAAVLADPVSVSLRSILLAPPAGGQPVLVYVSGTLAFAVIALLRHLYPAAEVSAATRPGARSALAGRLGAHAVLSTSPDELVAQIARRVGRMPLRPWSGHDWLQDGPAVVHDTIGSPETVETSLRLLTTGGTLVVSGVEPPKRLEWTPLYFKELHVIGSPAAGRLAAAVSPRHRHPGPAGGRRLHRGHAAAAGRDPGQGEGQRVHVAAVRAHDRGHVLRPGVRRQPRPGRLEGHRLPRRRAASGLHVSRGGAFRRATRSTTRRSWPRC